MNCDRMEGILPEYILGDVDAELALECKSHLDSCASCRTALQEYAFLIDDISGYPAPVVSQAESEALASAIRSLPVGVQKRPVASRRPTPEMVGFGVVSLVVFIAIVVRTILAGGILPAFSSISPFVAYPVGLGLLFLTSLLPIAVTARRRPLNGMTFKR